LNSRPANTCHSSAPQVAYRPTSVTIAARLPGMGIDPDSWADTIGRTIEWIRTAIGHTRDLLKEAPATQGQARCEPDRYLPRIGTPSSPIPGRLVENPLVTHSLGSSTYRITTVCPRSTTMVNVTVDARSMVPSEKCVSTMAEPFEAAQCEGVEVCSEEGGCYKRGRCRNAPSENECDIDQDDCRD